jgi:hypothetical protein
MSVTLEQQIACARRELSIRERVYPNWVEVGRMTPESMGRELRAMRAIVETLEGLRRPWDGTERRSQDALFTGPGVPQLMESSASEPTGP